MDNPLAKPKRLANVLRFGHQALTPMHGLLGVCLAAQHPSLCGHVSRPTNLSKPSSCGPCPPKDKPQMSKHYFNEVTLT
ncbi:hypothetical protein Csa_011483 [Cucumis sativus]|uniref:Uncharacterized protein n=1 Tax=Cucumis sativus TaxID=3659 RepID=A0A0A0L6Z4_CUCSA|nr:hypothetical protein Csa_011483 [Cucumis sativus]